MNPVLAQLYGTGFEKTASEYDDELDLDSISAADFLALMDDEDDFEKEAFDLSDLSASELMDLWEEADEMEEYADIEKMASDGSLDYFDTAGRIMAHAYADEMDKVASEGDSFIVDLEELSGDDLVELLDDGWEITDYDDHEKIAEIVYKPVGKGKAIEMHKGMGTKVKRVSKKQREANRAALIAKQQARSAMLKRKYKGKSKHQMFRKMLGQRQAAFGETGRATASTRGRAARLRYQRKASPARGSRSMQAMLTRGGMTARAHKGKLGLGALAASGLSLAEARRRGMI
jgi:hypothetical protein